jgi:hypothetical protein
MNERIKQLAKQAGFYPENNWDHTNWHAAGHNPTFEKFAELIVKECMNQVREQYLPVLEDELMMKDTHRDGYVQCGVDSYVAIKEHFGVEE